MATCPECSEMFGDDVQTCPSHGCALVPDELVAGEEVPTDVKGHTVAYDAARRLVLLPGGREGKSKVLILRPMNSSEPGMADDQRAGVR